MTHARLPLRAFARDEGRFDRAVVDGWRAASAARWLAGAGLLLSLGCGGRSIEDGAASAQPAPDAGPSDSGGTSSSAGAPETGAMSGNTDTAGAPGSAGTTSTPCVGTLGELKALGGAECPVAWCFAQTWASACNALPSDVTRTSNSTCDDAQSLEIELDNGDLKTCYYGAGGLNVTSDPELFAIALSSDTPRYCDGTSKRIVSKGAPERCSRAELVLCSGTTRDPAAPQPIARCFDAFSGTCGPCCPALTPDCSVEPDGFPGSDCIMSEGSYCECSCQLGKWDCEC